MIKALGCMKRFDSVKEKLTFRLQLGVFVFSLNTQCKLLWDNGKKGTHILAKLEEKKQCFHIDDVHGIIVVPSKASYAGIFISPKIPQLIMPYAHHYAQKLCMDHSILI